MRKLRRIKKKIRIINKKEENQKKMRLRPRKKMRLRPRRKMRLRLRKKMRLRPRKKMRQPKKILRIKIVMRNSLKNLLLMNKIQEMPKMPRL